MVSGLDSPTQLAIAGDGDWYVAQLAGGEDDASGQIIRLDADDPEGDRPVILDGLDKPTGVAVFAGSLWVMERNQLVRANLDGTDRRVVVDDMVFNGRSEGSLTVDGDQLLFNTSGRLDDRTDTPIDPSISSGVLWAITADETITPVAWGLKHAYAQTRDAAGVLWTTELADGSFDGQSAVDEVVAVVAETDHGWPWCVGDNRAVVEFGGTDDECALVPSSQAVFSSGATPTGIAISPWDQTQLLVALWVAGDVVSISIDPAKAPAMPIVVYEGAERPQQLLVDGDRVLLVDHGTGEILALETR